MTLTAQKARQHVGLDPLIVASMVDHCGLLQNITNDSEKLSKLRQCKEVFNNAMAF